MYGKRNEFWILPVIQVILTHLCHWRNFQKL